MPEKEKKPFQMSVDTPVGDIEFERNADGSKKLDVKVEKLPLFGKIKKIFSILKAK